MLAKRRCRRYTTRRRIGHLVRRAKLLGLSAVHLSNHFASASLCVLKSFGHRKHWLAAAIRIAHQLNPFVACSSFENFFYLLEQIVTVLARIELPRNEIFAINLATEVRPELRLERAQRHEFSVACLIDVIKRIRA